MKNKLFPQKDHVIRMWHWRLE